MSLLFTPALFIALGVALSIGSIFLFRSADSLLLVIGAVAYTFTTMFEACITSAWLWRYTVLGDVVDRSAVHS